MYETYSAFKSYGDFHAFARNLHISVVHARFSAVDAENKCQSYRAKEGSEDFSIIRSSFLFEDSIKAAAKLRTLEAIEAAFFNTLSEDAKNDMNRICKETDIYMQSARKEGRLF